MPFLAAGVEHRTSPFEIRERVALSGEDLRGAVLTLTADSAIDEVVILSTCNRTEIYCVSDAVDAAQEKLIALFASFDPEIHPYLQTWHEMDAVEHLFRVAAGLESQVLGEAQILSQVSGALDVAQELGSAGPTLHNLFRTAVSVARQARAGSALGRVNMSVGSEAVLRAQLALGELAGQSALIVGGGEVSRLVAEELQSRGLEAIFFANRTESVAVDLARRYGGRPVRLADIGRILPAVSLVFSATSARHYVLAAEDIAPRYGKTLHLFDLAVPRDIDPAAASVPEVVLHDLDDLLSDGITAQWEADIRHMEAVIGAEVHEFMAWYLTRRVAPIIAGLRSHVEAVSAQELKRVEPQLKNLTDREHAAVESLTNRLIDKMFHHLVVRLRMAAQTDPKLVEAAEFFFLHGEGGLFPDAARAGEQNTAEINR